VKKRKLLLMGALALVMAACQVKYDISTVVNADDSGSISYAISMDEEMRQALTSMQPTPDPNADPFADFEASSIPEGFTSERFTEGEFQGIRVSGSFANLDEFRTKFQTMQTGSADTGGSDPIFESFDITREGDSYTFTAAISQSAVGQPSEGATAAPIPGMSENPFGDLYRVLIRVTMPGGALENNATRLEGGAFVWEMNPAAAEAPDVLSAKTGPGGTAIPQGGGPGGGGNSKLPLYLAIGGGALLLIIIVALVMRSRKPAVAGGMPPGSYTPPAGGYTPPPPAGGYTPPPPAGGYTPPPGGAPPPPPPPPGDVTG